MFKSRGVNMKMFKKASENKFSGHLSFGKKGQGLSLNVIIVAALALIVLVVVAAIFIQQTGIFSGKINQEGSADLAGLQATYGTCHPSKVEEGRFLTALVKAETPEDGQVARDAFRSVIRNCNGLDSLGVCETNDDCDWQ
jgi:hypothetical protein